MQKAEGNMVEDINNAVIYPANVARLKLDWTFTSGAAIVAQPVFVDGVIYIASHDRHIYALSARTGSPLWKYATAKSINCAPAVVDEVVYIGSHDHKLYALDTATGRELWSYTTGGPIISSPTANDGLIVVGSNDQSIYAFRLFHAPFETKSC
jgi:outer membrane protein assembly factor BamB